jgi:hypothetical protein
VTEPSDLPPRERARRFRELGAEAARDAERTKDALREGYLLLARGWLQLAEDIEASLRRKSEDDVASENEAALRPPLRRKEGAI